MANLTNHCRSPRFINAVFYPLGVLIGRQSIGLHVTLLALPMTMSYAARPRAVTADRRPQGRRATNLMNVRSSCLSELFSEHPLLQLARAPRTTAALGCHRGSSLRQRPPTGTKAVPRAGHTTSLPGMGGMAGPPRH